MGRKNIGNGFLAGSYTVEAAFLVPLILGIFFAWLFELFYLHDQVIINGMLKEMAIVQEEGGQDADSSGDDAVGRGDNGQETDAQPERDAIQARLWIMEIQRLRLQKGITGKKYMIQSGVKWNIPIMERFVSNQFVYRGTAEAKFLRPETFVRLRGREE